MSQSLAKKIVRYRTLSVAVANGGVTWIVLIIAPLGLLAVIICTLAVFLSSLMVGWVSDRALLGLISDAYSDRESDRYKIDTYHQD
ncbi:CRISPR-associated protein Csx18 [Cronbergia sp. UHCC 0137]|uniref:CRISPR-associated protein Csx18 n=1 Tax=Cronbergia sp. UHCC 0137 TaxID=3110239 RepID=UPI002B1F7060|nr:CRISPR-associated protein Csx18 [Cronbergia sp. UHCC 0137]MEA5617043.1 CRISPR-associated protein Csx18 [Cronbergia sp. UHCC 0137]